MYTFLNYIPAVVTMVIVVLLIFKRQSKYKRIQWFLIIVFASGVICSHLRMELFISETLDGGAQIPIEVFIHTIKAVWVPTLISYIACFIIIGIARYKENAMIKKKI